MFLLCKKSSSVKLNCYVRKTYIFHRTIEPFIYSTMHLVWPNLTKFNKFTQSNYLKGRFLHSQRVSQIQKYRYCVQCTLHICRGGLKEVSTKGGEEEWGKDGSMDPQEKKQVFASPLSKCQMSQKVSQKYPKQVS